MTSVRYSAVTDMCRRRRRYCYCVVTGDISHLSRADVNVLCDAMSRRANERVSTEQQECGLDAASMRHDASPRPHLGPWTPRSRGSAPRSRLGRPRAHHREASFMTAACRDCTLPTMYANVMQSTGWKERR